MVQKLHWLLIIRIKTPNLTVTQKLSGWSLQMVSPAFQQSQLLGVSKHAVSSFAWPQSRNLHHCYCNHHYFETVLCITGWPWTCCAVKEELLSAGITSIQCYLSCSFFLSFNHFPFSSTTHLSPNHILLCVLLFNPLDDGVFRNGKIHVVTLFPTQPDGGCII